MDKLPASLSLSPTAKLETWIPNFQSKKRIELSKWQQLASKLSVHMNPPADDKMCNGDKLYNYIDHDHVSIYLPPPSFVLVLLAQANEPTFFQHLGPLYSLLCCIAGNYKVFVAVTYGCSCCRPNFWWFKLLGRSLFPHVPRLYLPTLYSTNCSYIVEL